VLLDTVKSGHENCLPSATIPEISESDAENRGISIMSRRHLRSSHYLRFGMIAPGIRIIAYLIFSKMLSSEYV